MTTMRNPIPGTIGFSGWCALVLAAPFIAYRQGVMTPPDFERWIAISYASTWRALVPPAVLLVSAALVVGCRRLPAFAAWAGGMVGLAASWLLMDRAMEMHAGKFDGLVEILTLLFGVVAVLLGVLIGTWRRKRVREASAA
jgi:hypothetical protein